MEISSGSSRRWLSPPQRPPTVGPWEKYTRSTRRLGRGKIKARRERWEGERKKSIVPRAPIFSLQCSRSRFFPWCLQTGASAEEREEVALRTLCPDRIGNWKCWFLKRGESQSTQRKASWSKSENHQTQPTYDSPESNPGHIGGRQVLKPLCHPNLRHGIKRFRRAFHSFEAFLAF